ncbi:hypothetical protein F945_00119 [Acinetobacter rudis CIP 110305]|uniref:Lipoprotein-34 (NlpB) n=2 Tax=Acinetobacter rudis TaxID=632955 RepID=S3P5U5_9GAMM|nr:hypothetical protein F945_00119 [Acinetobacter rudis CIP 110305]
MMQLRFGLMLSLAAMSLAGCSSMGISNGSLKYKKAPEMGEIKYPEGALVRPASPLYPAPVVEPMAIEHAPNFANSKGNRFALPRPEQQQANTDSTESVEDVAVGRPKLLTDGNGNPLLNVSGDPATIWQYALATLSSLNQNVVAKSKNAYEVTVKNDKQVYVLRMTSVGASNNIAIFNADSSFADKSKSSELLTQIYQNWPA